MILIDLQQVMISNIMMQMGFSGGSVEIPMFKHMVLNSLRSYKQKFGAKYGELVIATDTGSSWRKSHFPYYKANRKKDRDQSTLDWESIFEGLREIRADLRNYFPYRIIEVEGAEADDIIGTLCEEFGSDLPGSDPILIISGDKDFKQLQTHLNVEQYDPVRNKKIVENNPDNYLVEHIISGDRGDGVPNILSEDNCLVLGTRQGTMSKKRMEHFKQCVSLNGTFDNETHRRNWNRNCMMIDLTCTPSRLKEEILEEYEKQASKGRDKVFNYFIKNKMKLLLEVIQDF